MHELCEFALFPHTWVNKTFTFQCKVKDLSLSYSQEARSSKPRNRRKKNTLPTQEDPNEHGEDEQEEEDIEQDDPEEAKGIPGTQSNCQLQLPIIPHPYNSHQPLHPNRHPRTLKHFGLWLMR